MEIEAGPVNFADPAEDDLPARGPEIEPENVLAAGEGILNRPDQTDSSAVVPRETEATSVTPFPSPGVTPKTASRSTSRTWM